MSNWEEIPEIDLFSDGGAEPNPGKGGFGVILRYKGRTKEFNKGYKITTNNRMELMGVIYGLGCLKTKSKVTIYTDSRYVVDGIEKGWTEKWKQNNWIRGKGNKAINHDLWMELLELMAEHEYVKFNWIKGHAGHPENERCDELANIALNSERLFEDKGYITTEKNVLGKTNSKPIITKSINKIEKEGDFCRKCGTAVIKKIPKKRKIKENQTYYFEYYFFCSNCNTIYFVDEAKKN